MTNAHVVANAQRVRVSRNVAGERGVEWMEARVVGRDEETDLAVLAVDRKGLPSLGWAEAGTLRQGQMVVALGSPMGLTNSLTMGVLSAKERPLREDAGVAFLQTDAPINPGNSGGPLVDLDGRIVGINTLILTQSGGSEGLGFAIPGRVAERVYRQIRAKGKVERGDIGITLQSMTPGLARGLGLQRRWGAIVTGVEERGAAGTAGIRAHDVVVRVDGAEVENAAQFRMALDEHGPGETVRLGIDRDGKEMELVSAVLERKPDPREIAKKVTPETNLVAQIGLLCVDVDETTQKMMPGLQRPYGVIVAARAPSVSSQQTPLEPGDVIYSINGKLIPDLTSFRGAMTSFGPGSAVVFEVERAGKPALLEMEWE